MIETSKTSETSNQNIIDTAIVADKAIEQEKPKAPLIKPVAKNSKKVKDYCRKLDKKFLHWGWGEAK